MVCIYTDRLAVGTDKGLIILDTLKNTLIQMIGSEKKLLGELCYCITLYNLMWGTTLIYTAELSGCDDHGGSSVPRARLINVHKMLCACDYLMSFFANSNYDCECKVVKLCAAKICFTASQQDG